MRHYKIILFFILFMLVLSSCEDNTGVGTLRIQFSGSEVKTIGVSSNIYTPVKYALTGTGPGNKTLSIESNSSLIVRDGVQLGTWTFTGKSYNSDGQVIGTGQTSFTLSAESDLHNLELTETKDNGSCKLTFQWNQEISQPRIELSIASVYGTIVIKKTIAASDGSSNTSLTLSDLKPDYYYLSSTLVSNGVVVSSSVEILVIASNNRTVGTIDLSNYSSSTTEEMTVMVGKVKGTITTTSNINSSGEIVTFSLQLDKALPIKWFLDGQEIAGVNNQVSFTTTPGYHIVNAIALDNENNLAGSGSFKFLSSISGKPGSVAVDTEISNMSDKSSLFAALPNNKFLILTPTDGKLSLCHLENTGFISDYVVLSTEPNWEFLDNATNLYANLDSNIFVVVDNYCNINVLQYNEISNALLLCYHGQNILRYVNGGSAPPMNFKEINTLFIGQGPNNCINIIASDPSTTRSVCFKAEGDTVTSACSLYDPTDNPNVLGFTVCSDFVLAISKTSSNLFYAAFDGIGKTGLWQEVNSQISSLKFIKRLNDTTIVVSDGQTICRYSLSGLTSWILRGHVNCQVKDLQVSSNGKYIYVLNDKNFIETYRLIGSSIEWQAEKLIQTPIEKLVVNEKTILGITSSGSFVICPVIQEET